MQNFARSKKDVFPISGSFHLCHLYGTPLNQVKNHFIARVYTRYKENKLK